MIPKKKIFVVFANYQSVSGDSHSFEVARLSTREKAERCLNLFRLANGDDLYGAIEGPDGEMIQVYPDIDVLGKFDRPFFSVGEVEITPIDTFTVEDQEYDWRG